MSKPQIQTVRALARELGVSHTTVSDALRDNPRVSAKTRERVKKAAKELGYHYNPLAGAIMSEIRRSSIGTFHGTVAIVDMESDKERRPGAKPYHAEMLRGARDAAGRLGFKVDHFILGEEHIPVSRLNGILKTRGITAALFLPVSRKPKVSEFNWECLTGIYTDYLIDDPALHTVCPDHFRSMTIALRKLMELGYKRPGLVLNKSHDRRILFRWEAAFSSYWGRHTDYEATAPLVTDSITPESFLEWFDATKPDVVLCHQARILDWMKEKGCKIPETHGFCCLNVVSAQINTAGLDLLPRLGGTRAMELLIAQLQRNEYGIPKTPSTMTYAAEWRDGPTLRQQ